MLAILYLLVSIYCGCFIAVKFLQPVKNNFSSYFYRWILITICIPLGLMFTSSWVYLFYYLFKNSSYALALANMTIMLPLIILLKFFPLQWSKEPCWYSSRMHPENFSFFS
jgi:hypothetical protein